MFKLAHEAETHSGRSYFCDENGTVISRKHDGSQERTLAQANAGYKRKYKRVTLGYGNQVYVHRLVGALFLPNEDVLPEINHKNLNTNDNRVCNLEWCTREYNAQYSQNIAMHLLGYGFGEVKVTDELDEAIKGYTDEELYIIGSKDV